MNFVFIYGVKLKYLMMEVFLICLLLINEDLLFGDKNYCLWIFVLGIKLYNVEFIFLYLLGIFEV